MLDGLAVFLSVCAILATLLPLLRHDAWWIRAFEFPRVQVTAITVAVLVVFVALAGWRDGLDKAIIGVLLLCILFQLIRIAPYTPVYPKQLKASAASNDGDTLSLLVANVYTPNRNAEALLRLVRDRSPDIVLAVETDQWWQSKLDALDGDYPHSVKHPLDNLYGMHLYSRLPLTDPRVLFLVEDDVPSIHAEVTLQSGHRVDLHCLHPAPPSPTENPTAAERDAELLVVAKTLDSKNRSVVVMGDLNDVAWSATTRLFQKLSGLLDPRVGRGMFNTFHAKYPFMRWPLDHIFCSGDFALVSLARLGDIGSDHFPIHAVLHHAPDHAVIHDRPEASETDRELAEEKIGKADADERAIRRG